MQIRSICAHSVFIGINLVFSSKPKFIIRIFMDVSLNKRICLSEAMSINKECNYEIVLNLLVF